MTHGVKAAGTPGLLLVMLDAAEGEEQELHDWYDLEHVPERAAISGFLTLQRYVCLEGWPRYLALYDLSSLAVLRSAAYQAIAGDNFSPWSKRVISKLRGWMRSEAELVGPAPSLTGAAGAPLRLGVISYKGLEVRHEGDLLDRLLAWARETPGVLQTRLFRCAHAATQEQTQTQATLQRHYALIELSVPRSLSDFDWGRLSPPSGVVDVANVYSRYWRSQS